MHQKTKKNKSFMNESLMSLGLTVDQAIVYELLIENGPLRAQRLAFLAGFSRPLTYKVLGQLIEIGLVEKSLSQSNN